MRNKLNKKTFIHHRVQRISNKNNKMIISFQIWIFLRSLEDFKINEIKKIVLNPKMMRNFNLLSLLLKYN